MSNAPLPSIRTSRTRCPRGERRCPPRSARSDAEELYAAIPERPPGVCGRSTSPRRFGRSTSSAGTSRPSSTGTRAARDAQLPRGGCWQHYVPGGLRRDRPAGGVRHRLLRRHVLRSRKAPGLFEYASMVGELVELDAVSMPTFDWGSAAATALCMAARITGRRTVLVPDSMGEERHSIVAGYCEPWVELRTIPFEPASGRLDLGAVGGLLDEETACVYLEMPGYLGTIETEAAEIAGARARGRRPRGRRRRPDLARRSRSPPGTARTSSAASCSRSGSTCTTEAALPVSSPRRTRSGSSPSIPPSSSGSDRRSSKGSTPSERSSGSGRRTSSGATRRSSPGRRSSSGGSSRARTSRSSARRGIAELGRGIMERSEYAPSGSERSLESVAGARRAVLQGVRRRLRRDGKNGRRRQPRPARARDLRRQPTCRTSSRTRAERSLLRDGDAHEGRHRSSRRRARGGAPMTLRPFHQARWNEPVILETSSPGERGMLVPEPRRRIRERGRRPAREVPEAAPRGAAEAPRAEPAADPPALPSPLAGDARERRQHPPRPGHVHDEVQPQGERGADPLADVADLHPLQDDETVQGILEVLHRFERMLCEISGLDRFSFQPAGGRRASTRTPASCGRTTKRAAKRTGTRS